MHSPVAGSRLCRSLHPRPRAGRPAATPGDPAGMSIRSGLEATALDAFWRDPDDPRRKDRPRMADVYILGTDYLSMDLLATVLREEGYAVESAASSEQLDEQLTASSPDVLFIDLDEPLPARISLVSDLQKAHPDIVLAMSIHEDARELAAAGASLPSITYIRKPFDLIQLVAKIHDLFEQHELAVAQIDASCLELNLYFVTAGLIAQSPSMQAVVKAVRQYAALDHPVCVHGERGTDKEGVARALHDSGPHASGAFLSFSCEGSCPPALTTIVARVVKEKGLRGGGTLFVDRIEDMPEEAQRGLVALLAVRPEKGQNVLRVVVGTEHPPSQLPAHGVLPGLVSKVMLFAMEMKPLRQRGDDILPLVARALKVEGEDTPQPDVPWEAAQMLTACPWPGNESQLTGVIQGLLPAVKANGNVLSLHLLQDVLPG